MKSLEIREMDEWERIQKALPIGTRITGTVVAHKLFGIFVSINKVPFKGLREVINFKDEQERVTPADYPEVGQFIDAVIVGFQDIGRQIRLSIKPSLLGKSQ